MNPAARISVHVVASPSALSTVDVLGSLHSQTTHDFSIVLVESGARESVIPWSIGEGPDVVRLRTFHHLGQSRGHNQAIRLAFSRWGSEDLSCRFLILLSSHVLLSETALEHLARVLQEDDRFDLACPKVLRAYVRTVGDDGERETEASGVIEAAGALMDRSGRWIVRGRGEKDGAGYMQSGEVALPSEHLIMIRASALQKLGRADEWLDPDLSDRQALMDLALRARRGGLKTRYVPDGVIWEIVPHPSRKQGGISSIRRWYSQEARDRRWDERATCLLQIKNARLMEQIRSIHWILLGRIRFLFFTLIDPLSWPRFIHRVILFPRMIRKRYKHRTFSD